MNFKNAHWIFLKFSTLISTEKLQSHFFTVTEILNSDKFMTSLPLWVKSADAKKLFYVHLNSVVGLLTHTHTHPFSGPFVRDYPGEPVPER